jgi:hypothetical protein
MEPILWLRYSYIFYLSIWLAIDAWTIEGFRQCISSPQSPTIVRRLCESILSGLCLGDLFFFAGGLVFSWVIFNQKQTGHYFVFTYAIYTVLTNHSMFNLLCNLIDYEQQQGIWNVSSPGREALFIVLLISFLLLAAVPYYLGQFQKIFDKTN